MMIKAAISLILVFLVVGLNASSDGNSSSFNTTIDCSSCPASCNCDDVEGSIHCTEKGLTAIPPGLIYCERPDVIIL